ncbi:MAG: hypothetical protein HDT42_00300 [Ruminococcaceae bacterium]|nr:hypothetical protein [Oscillospiraceae bacterium]
MKFKGKKSIMAAALSAIVAASSLGTTITANAANTYDIEVNDVRMSPGSSGTINVSKLENISLGEEVTVTVTPDPGCYIVLFTIFHRGTELYCFWGKADDGISTNKMEYTFAIPVNAIVEKVEVGVGFDKIDPNSEPNPAPNPTPTPTPTPEPTPTPTWKKGDANCDGRVNAEDATAVLKHLTGIMELSYVGSVNADMDQNGKVTAADATAILKSLVGIE